MKENDLYEALAAELADCAEAPLADCEVRIFPQVEYSNPAGFVCIAFERTGGAEIPVGIGDKFANDVTMRIRGAIAFADTVENRQRLLALCEQIRSVLRGNRQLVVGDEKSEANGDISWEYRLTEHAGLVYRVCDVSVTYRIPQEDAGG